MRQLVNGLLDANWPNNQTILGSVKNECPLKTRSNLPHQIVRMQTNSHPICIHCFRRWLTEFDCAKRIPRTKNREFDLRRFVCKFSPPHNEVARNQMSRAPLPISKVSACMQQWGAHGGMKTRTVTVNRRMSAREQKIYIIERRKNPYGVCAGGIWDTPAQCTKVRQQLLSLLGVIPTIWVLWVYARWNCIARSVVSWKVAAWSANENSFVPLKDPPVVCANWLFALVI